MSSLPREREEDEDGEQEGESFFTRQRRRTSSSTFSSVLGSNISPGSPSTSLRPDTLVNNPLESSSPRSGGRQQPHTYHHQVYLPQYEEITPAGSSRRRLFTDQSIHGRGRASTSYGTGHEFNASSERTLRPNAPSTLQQQQKSTITATTETGTTVGPGRARSFSTLSRSSPFRFVPREESPDTAMTSSHRSLLPPPQQLRASKRPISSTSASSQSLLSSLAPASDTYSASTTSLRTPTSSAAYPFSFRPSTSTSSPRQGLYSPPATTGSPSQPSHYEFPAQPTNRQHHAHIRASTSHAHLSSPSSQERNMTLGHSSEPSYFSLSSSFSRRHTLPQSKRPPSVLEEDQRRASERQERPTKQYRSARSEPSEHRNVISGNFAAEAPPPSFLGSTNLMNLALEPRRYRLIVRQQPEQGRAGTFGSKERRPLDPLPIVQLEIFDKYGNLDLLGSGSPNLVMQVSALPVPIEEEAQEEVTLEDKGGGESVEGMKQEKGKTLARASHGKQGQTGMHLDPAVGNTYASCSSSDTASQHQKIEESGRQTHKKATAPQYTVMQRMLEGKVTSSAHVAFDTDGSRACFFIFSDLSLRIEGTFKLVFSLVRLGMGSGARTSVSSSPAGEAGASEEKLSPPQRSRGLSSSSLPSSKSVSSASLSSLRSASVPSGKIVATVSSDAFKVYSPREFPGVAQSTDLAKCLANQGVQIPIRNEARRGGSAAGRHIS